MFGGVSPRMERIKVVLPEPLDPSRHVIAPAAAVSDTLSSTLAWS